MIHTSDKRVDGILHNTIKDAKRAYAKHDENGSTYYYNLECSFDIESTSMMVQDEKVAFMYIWMFELGDGSEVIYGRTWQEALELFNKVSKMMKLDEQHILICYIHNMSFEFQFMMKLFKWVNVFAVGERKPIKALTSIGIEFRDSYILSGMNLAKTGENLVSHKVRKQVGSLDYDKIRTQDTVLTDEELLYCEDDVRVVTSYINEQINQYGDIAKIPLTNTGRVRRLVGDACYFTDKSHKKSSSGKYKRYRFIMNNLTLEPDEYKMLKRAFQGGFTHANAEHVGKVLENVGSFDFTSSYPSVMLQEMYPMSKGFKIEINTMQELKEACSRYALVFDVEFTNILNTFKPESYISESKCWKLDGKVVNNGRVVVASKLATTITNVDYSIIEKVYSWDSMKIGNVIAYQKGFLPKAIITSILDLYQKKTTLKRVKGKEVEYLTSKGMLNSVYGMSVTDIVQETNTYTNNDGWSFEPADLDEQIGKYNKAKKRFLFYPWGVFVTAYARRNLWTGILNVGNDYVYSDTDSLKCLNIESHMDYIRSYNNIVDKKLDLMVNTYDIDKELLAPKTIEGVVKPIGVWDSEGIYDRFKTLGAKRYMIEKDGKLSLTVAGLSKKNGLLHMEKLANGDNDKVFSMFNDKLYISAAGTGKMTHTYIDTKHDFMCVDFQGHESHIVTESGVHLEPCDFTLSLAIEFKSFIDHLRKGEFYKGVNKTL